MFTAVNDLESPKAVGMPVASKATAHDYISRIGSTQIETMQILLSVYRDLTGERIDAPEYKEPEHMIMALGISDERGEYLRRLASMIREAL